MRRTLQFWLLATCVVSLQATAAPRYIQGYVERISDGDTIHVQPMSRTWEENGFFVPGDFDMWAGSKTRLKIRMLGMDTPESHLPTQNHGVVAQIPWGDWATKGLESVLKIRDRVTLAHHGFDIYRRVLGTIYKGKNDINLWMVRAGYAVPYIICDGKECNSEFFRVQRVREYLMACDAARRENRGIFNRSRPLKELPFEFRLRMMHRKPNKWVGNYSNRRLHAPNKYKAVDVCRRIFFMRKDEAHRVGFR